MALPGGGDCRLGRSAAGRPRGRVPRGPAGRGGGRLPPGRPGVADPGMPSARPPPRRGGLGRAPAGGPGWDRAASPRLTSPPLGAVGGSRAPKPSPPASRLPPPGRAATICGYSFTRQKKKSLQNVPHRKKNPKPSEKNLRVGLADGLIKAPRSRGCSHSASLRESSRAPAAPAPWTSEQVGAATPAARPASPGARRGERADGPAGAAQPGTRPPGAGRGEARRGPARPGPARSRLARRGEARRGAAEPGPGRPAGRGGARREAGPARGR